MTTHLTMEQLLDLRDPGSEPGSHGARAHLEECVRCRTEHDRLHQRVARIKALPALRPSRSRFADIQRQLQAERRRQLTRRGTIGLALAASLAALVFALPRSAPGGTAISPGASLAELETNKLRSQQLEATLNAMNLDSRVLDGRTAGLVFRIEDQLGLLDRELQLTSRMTQAVRTQRELQLWRERVGLLDALIDVHLTRARNAGL